MELLDCSETPSSFLPHDASFWQRCGEFFARHRVRFSLALFAALMAEDVLIGVVPHNPFDLQDPRAAAGLLCILLGTALRSWAAGIVRKNSQLASNGPYALMRHPLYVGSFAMMIGFCLIIDDVENIWIVLGPLLAMYLYHIRREEQQLAARFGQCWQAYAAQVPRFVPVRLTSDGLAAWSWRQWLQNREYQALAGVAVGLAAIEIWRSA